MTIETKVFGVSDRAYNNAAKAFMSDPRRPLRLLDFMTSRERQTLLFTALGDVAYEQWLEERGKQLIGSYEHVESVRDVYGNIVETILVRTEKS